MPVRVYVIPIKNVYINFPMRALVPLGEKSSESVPERVLPYRHILQGYISVNQDLGNTFHSLQVIKLPNTVVRYKF